MLYFIASLEYILWTKTLREDKTGDLKFLTLLMVIELVAVKDISLIIWTTQVHIKFSTVSNGACYYFEF